MWGHLLWLYRIPGLKSMGKGTEPGRCFSVHLSELWDLFLWSATGHTDQFNGSGLLIVLCLFRVSCPLEGDHHLGPECTSARVAHLRVEVVVVVVVVVNEDRMLFTLETVRAWWSWSLPQTTGLWYKPRKLTSCEQGCWEGSFPWIAVALALRLMELWQVGHCVP